MSEYRQKKFATNKVFQTIGLLPFEDQKKLIKFVDSKYFNQSKKISDLCKLFVTYTAINPVGFDKFKIWDKIFPNKDYNDVNFRKYCSDLLELVEKFLSIENYLSNAERLNLDKIEYISINKIVPLYRNVISNTQKIINSKKYLTQNDYYFAYSFENKYHKLMNFDVKASPNLNIEKISENLDIFYLINKLKIIINAKVQNLRSSIDYDLNDIDSVLKLCDKYDLSIHPELAIYLYSYKTLKFGDNLEYYYSLKKVLDQSLKYLSQTEAIEIVDSALNYCIGRVNKGDRQFYPEYFDIFLNAIQLGVFVVNGEIATWRFNNIIVAGLRLGKLEWADQFVEKNKHLLSDAVKNNIVEFNLARISLYKKDYKKVLSHIKDVEYEDIFINLTSKIMISISYYELDEYETLDPFIESFRTFINRQKEIQVTIKQSHLLFLGFLRRIMRNVTADKKITAKIRTDIRSAKPNPVNQEWLLEKLQELE